MADEFFGLLTPTSSVPLRLRRHADTRIRRDRRQGHVRLRVRRLRGTVGPVVRPDLGRPRGNVPPEERPVEDLQRRDGLVVRHLVARLVDTGEGEVAVLARLAVLDAVDDQGRVARGAELGRVFVVGGQGDGLAAEPVADVVGVAVDEGDADGELEELLEVVDEVGPDKVAGLLEGVVDLGVGGGVVDVDADGVHDVVLLQVFGEEVGWGGVLFDVSSRPFFPI